MEEQLSNYYQIGNPAYSEAFLSIDLFDELMVSLAGIYLQLEFNEKTKDTPDPELAESYHQRHQELLILKESFPINAIEDREKAMDIYSEELNQANLLLQLNLESRYLTEH